MKELLQFFYPFVIHLYLWWARLYRRAFLQAYSHVPVVRFKEPKDVQAILNKVVWKPDGILQLYDAIGTEQRFQYILDQIEIKGQQPADMACDCDDFSAYCVATLHPRYHAKYLFVAWLKKSGNIAGHAVCLFQDPITHEYWHMGNWGIRGPYVSYASAARDIVRETSSENLIGYSVANHALRAEYIARG